MTRVQRVFFDHLPKTGGTSVHALLRARYGDAAVSPKFANLRISEALAKHPGATVISGHVFLFPGDRLPEGFVSMTVLRDPVDRIVSEYFYKKHDASPVSATGPQALADLTFEDYVARGGDGTIDLSNYQAKHLALYSGEVDPGNTAELLDAATRALDRFDLVAPTENLQELVDVLGWMLDWDVPMQVPLENRTSRRPSVHELGARTLRRLRELNSVDIELHRHAQRRLLESLSSCVRRSYPVSAGHPVTARPEAANDEAVARASTNASHEESGGRREFGDRTVEILDISALGSLSVRGSLMSGEMASVHVVLRSSIDCDDVTVGFHIRDEAGSTAFGTNTRLLGYALRLVAGATYTVTFSFANLLGLGKYFVGAAVHTGHTHLDRCFHWIDDAASLEVTGNIGQGFDGRTKLMPQLSAIAHAAVDGSANASPLVELAHQPHLLTILNAPLNRFDGRLTVLSSLESLAPGEAISVEVEIENRGDMTWPAGGQRPVCVSYHWLDEEGRPLLYEGQRTAIPVDLLPGQASRLWATVVAPTDVRPRWRLRMTLIQEWVAWFDEHGGAFDERFIRPKLPSDCRA